MSSTIPFARLRMLPLALAALACSRAAMADISDTIHPFVAVGYTYDDNLLRLPDNVTGYAQRSDRTTQTQAGIIFNRPVGRQVFSGSAKVSRVTFDYFDQLDYNGKDMKVDWAWQLGNHLQGNIGATYMQTLTPFTDFHSDVRNLRTQRRQYANGAYRFHPSWQVRGAYSQDKYEYELAVQRLNNRTEDLREVGVDYLAKSGSRAGILARQLKGHYLNPFRFNGAPLQDDYTQDELKANVWWEVSAITKVQILAGYARRKHDYFTRRDASGANGRVSVRWAPLGKVQFTADAWREFAAVESNVVSNSLNKGGSVGATWNISSKLQAVANARRETRKFEELGNINFTGDPSDRVGSASVGLTYAPTMKIQLGLTAFRDKRNGSALTGTNDYKANGLSFNASAQF